MFVDPVSTHLWVQRTWFSLEAHSSVTCNDIWIKMQRTVKKQYLHPLESQLGKVLAHGVHDDAVAHQEVHVVASVGERGPGVGPEQHAAVAGVSFGVPGVLRV